MFAPFLAYHALIYRWECQFISLFSQDNKHKELTVHPFFQNPYAIFVHILQHYYDFQSNLAIFPSVVQTYTQPHSFSGRIQLITSQLRPELRVTIHEISTNWKKMLDGGPNTIKKTYVEKNKLKLERVYIINSTKNIKENKGTFLL